MALTDRARARRRRLCGMTEEDRRNGNSIVCGGKMARNGEAKTCLRCETCRYYDESYYQSLNSKRLSAWILAQE